MKFRELFSLFYRAFIISKWRSRIINWIVPFIFVLLFGLSNIEKKTIDFNVILTISAIMLGFNASIITMLITVNNETTTKLKATSLHSNKFTMHEGLIYKMGYVVLVLTMNIIYAVITFSFSLTQLWVSLISLYIILNSLLVMIETIAEYIFVYSK